MFLLLRVCIQGKASKWRKTEAYIAAVRYWLNREIYNTWKNFLYQDFRDRQALRITFEKRHLKVSDGNDHKCFGGKVERMAGWDKQKKVLIRSMKKRKSKTTSSRPRAKKVKKQKQEKVQTVYDHRTNRMVSLIELDDES